MLNFSQNEVCRKKFNLASKEAWPLSFKLLDCNAW